jgi:hypothetical protein
MAMQFRVEVEIEGSAPDTFKIGFKFSDEEKSGIEFYTNHDLPEDVSEKLGALAVGFINDIGDLVLTRLSRSRSRVPPEKATTAAAARKLKRTVRGTYQKAVKLGVRLAGFQRTPKGKAR